MPVATAGGAILLGIDDDRAVAVEIGQIASRLHGLEGELDIDGARFDQGRVNHSLAESQMGLHRAASLGHAVDLAFFDIETGCQQGIGGQLAGQQNTLAADAAEMNVSLPFHQLPSLMVMASNLQRPRHWPQPMHMS